MQRQRRSNTATHTARVATIIRSLLLLLVALCGATADTVGQSAQPNILFCIADDWGWPHASAYGDPVVATPAFDRVAREGVLFEHCYVSSPSCTPSRNAILTGQYHWRLGAGANLWSSLDKNIPVYPLLLEANGYFVGHWRKSWGPGRVKVGGYTDSHPAGDNYPKGFAQFLQAREKASAKTRQPFCFWLGAFDPHRGYKAGSGKQSGMDIDKVPVPGFWPNVEAIRSDIADYYFEVQRFDQDVGNALQLLEASGELDNTIVVVTGDHGMPFPRCKSNCYDMGVRVPLAIRWGKNIQAGLRIRDFVSLIDLAPTFLAAASVAAPKQINGRSLLSILASSQVDGLVEPSRDHVIYGKERHVPCRPDHSGYPTRGIRTERWAYLRNFEPSRWPVGDPPLYGDTDPAHSIGKGTTKGYLLTNMHDAEVERSYQLCFARRPAEELYDMHADPDQLHNLAGMAEHAPILKKLWQQLRSELAASHDPRIVGGAEQFDRFPYYGGGAWRPQRNKPEQKKKQ